MRQNPTSIFLLVKTISAPIQMAAADGEDWRITLLPESRTRIVNKIADCMMRHFLLSGPESLQELTKTATRLENKIYTEAQSVINYLRRISLKMLTLESTRRDASSGSSFNSPPYDEF